MQMYGVAWGSNDNNQLKVPFEISKNPGQSFNLISGQYEISDLSVGYNHTIANIINPNIGWTGWGDNTYGQILDFNHPAIKNFQFKKCECGVQTTYFLDYLGRIHGFGKDLLFSSVSDYTGIIFNWNEYIFTQQWPQSFRGYPQGFSKISANDEYLLAIRSGKITGWGAEIFQITGNRTGQLRSGFATNFRTGLNSGSYVTVNLTGNWTGWRAIWRQSQDNNLFYDLDLYRGITGYKSGLSIVEGGLGQAVYSGYLDNDKSFLQVVLGGSGVVSGRGTFEVSITGYLGTNWQNKSGVINISKFNEINRIGNVIDVSAGKNHAIVLFSGSSGLISGWGDNSLNQLSFNSSYISGAKVSTKIDGSYAIGLKNPVISNITGVDRLTVFYANTGSRITGLELQVKPPLSNSWVTPSNYLFTGSNQLNSNNRLTGISPTGDIFDKYYYRLVSRPSGVGPTGFITGSSASYIRAYLQYDTDDYILYGWGGTGNDNILYTTRFFPALGQLDYNGPSLSGKEYLDYFTQLNNLPGNTSNSKKYYDVKIGDCHFFVLDTDPLFGEANDGIPANGAGIGDPSDPSDNSEYVNTQQVWFNSGISGSSSKWKFVVCNYPIYTSDSEITPGEYNGFVRPNWNFSQANCVFNGRANSYERLKDSIFENITYYLVNGAGGIRLQDIGWNTSYFDISEYRHTGSYGFTKLRIYENCIVTSFVDINLYERDIFIIPESVTPQNLINTFAMVGNYGVSGSSIINTVSNNYLNPENNYYTYKVAQAIFNSNVDAIFSVGDNGTSGSSIDYLNNVGLMYGDYFVGETLPKNQYTIPNKVKNVNVFDVSAGYNTNMILTSVPLAEGTNIQITPVASPIQVTPAPCNLVYDEI